MRFLRLLLLLPAAAVLARAEPRLDIDSANSRVEVDVKATVDSFTGHLEHFAPAVTVADDGHVTGARFAFQFTDLKTGKPKRDQAMHDWQQTPQFPDGEFVLGKLTKGAENQYTAEGTLRLHGVTQPISFPLSIIVDRDVYALDGDAVVDTRKFGLPIIRMMVVIKVDPEVHVRFHLQGRKVNG